MLSPAFPIPALIGNPDASAYHARKGGVRLFMMSIQNSEHHIPAMLLLSSPNPRSICEFRVPILFRIKG
jgi:hypothetical protein